MRTLLARIGTLLLATAVAILIAEAMLWAFFPIPYREFLESVPDGRISGRPKPHQLVTNTNGETVTVNRFGFRGPDWDYYPAKGTLRLLLFGGSAAFDYRVGDDDTWAHHLQVNLSHDLGMPVEVVNLGVAGYDLTHSKINYLFLGRALHPHLVLVYHTWNDMKKFRNIDEGKPDIFAPVRTGKPLWMFLARETQLARRVRNALRTGTRAYEENRYTSMEEQGDRANQPVGPAALAWFEQNYRDIARFTRADGVLPVFITEATIVQPQNLDKVEYRRNIGVDMQGMTLPILSQTWLKANEIEKKVAAEESALFIDGRAAVTPDFDHLEDHVHLTAKGTEQLSRAVANALIAEPRFQEVVARVRSQANP